MSSAQPACLCSDLQGLVFVASLMFRLPSQNVASCTVGTLSFMRGHTPAHSSVMKDLSALVPVVDQTGGGSSNSFCSFCEPWCDARDVLPPFHHVRSSSTSQELE